MIGLIGALDEEIDLLLKELNETTIQDYAGIRFFQGCLNGQLVVVCKSGVGKVNAALTAQILIDLFRVTAVIVTGVAGALHQYLNIGDIVISTKTKQYDVDFTPLGFPPGVIPYLKTSVFDADHRLVQLAGKAAKSIKGRIFKGKVLSGDRFITGRKAVNRLRKLFDGLCVEAEGAAVGQVCYLNKIPFVVIRGISDIASQAEPSEFFKFVTLAAHRSQLVVLAMLKQL